MRFFRNVAAGVGDDIGFIALFERREHGADDADRGPQAGEDDAVLVDAVDLVDHHGVFPSIHARAIEQLLTGEGFGDLVEHRTRETLLGDRGQDGGHVETCGAIGNERSVITQQFCGDRFRRECHLRLKIDKHQSVVAGVQQRLGGGWGGFDRHGWHSFSGKLAPDRSG